MAMLSTSSPHKHTLSDRILCTASKIMAFKRLHVSRTAKVKKISKHSGGLSKSSMRSFVSKLSLSNIRSSLNGSVTANSPLPTTIQCGLSHKVSRCVALAGGSYFHVESMLLREFAEVRRPGSIRSTQVGFMSPYYYGKDTKNSDYNMPTYEQVMTGTSGHVMVVLVELEDPVADFEDLIRFFFQIHDPTTKYRQGQDRGFQFASWIFCGDQEQYDVAKRVRGEVQELLDQGLFQGIYSSQSVTTNMSLLGNFAPGPDDHQQRLGLDYDLAEADGCGSNRLRFESWPSLLTDDNDDASSLGLDSMDSDETDERIEASVRSSAHFRHHDSLVHTMIRISMCNSTRDTDEASSM